jgi:multidrug efflux pump
MLPVTLIFVLSASLIVALIFLPVMGGVAGRMSRTFGRLGRAARRSALVGARGAGAGAMYGLPRRDAGAEPRLPPAAPSLARPPAAGRGAVHRRAVASSITLGARGSNAGPPRVRAGYRRTPFGRFIRFIAGNPVMPVVAIARSSPSWSDLQLLRRRTTAGWSSSSKANPSRRSSMSAPAATSRCREGRACARGRGDRARHPRHPESAFAFAGEGGLNQNTGGAGGPRDAIGQVQIELVPWEDRPAYAAAPTGMTAGRSRRRVVIADLQARLSGPGIQTEILNLSHGPGLGQAVHLRLKGDDLGGRWPRPRSRARASTRRRASPTSRTRAPCPASTGRSTSTSRRPAASARTWPPSAAWCSLSRAASCSTRCGCQLGRGDRDPRPPAREDRVLSTLDTLKVRTPRRAGAAVELHHPRAGGQARPDRPRRPERYFDVKADVAPTSSSSPGRHGRGDPRPSRRWPGRPIWPTDRRQRRGLRWCRSTPTSASPVLTEWLETDRPCPPASTGNGPATRKNQAESQAFLMHAFAGALGLMFIILLAQFNSFYNSVLVLLAVVLSTTGVLIGMLVMDQPFSIIMTGTGIVALAGIVVNNNIVLIDTYQEYSRYMPRIEAIIRTAEDRIRPAAACRCQRLQ